MTIFPLSLSFYYGIYVGTNCHKAGQQVMNVQIQGEQVINVNALPVGVYIMRSNTGAVARFIKQ
jgi:hypothetical protein